MTYRQTYYLKFQGCYFNNHEDLLLPGLHDGEHTFGLRWKKDLLEWQDFDLEIYCII